MAELPGKWSSPEVIYVEQIPYPVMVDIPTLSNIMPVRNVDGVLISFSFTLEINLSIEPTDDPIIPTNISTTPPIFKRRKREAVLESGMVVSEFGIAIGFKPVEDPYGDVPSSSVEIVIPVCMYMPFYFTREIPRSVINSFISLSFKTNTHAAEIFERL